MADAARDENNVPTMIAILDSDGQTLTRIKADPTTHDLMTANGATGSDLTGDNALRDENSVTGLLAVSEADNSTPVPLYADSNGNLLIDTN